MGADDMHSNNLICDILKYINDNINEKISIEKLSSNFHYNRYYIMKLFKKEIHVTINNYINIKRIYDSLIEYKSNINILNIAIKHGFIYQEYYTEIFIKLLGVNPSIYKNYIKYHNINNEDLMLLRDNLTKMNNIIEFTKNYLANRRRSNKVLTIFKSL